MIDFSKPYEVYIRGEKMKEVYAVQITGNYLTNEHTSDHMHTNPQENRITIWQHIDGEECIASYPIRFAKLQNIAEREAVDFG